MYSKVFQGEQRWKSLAQTFMQHGEVARPVMSEGLELVQGKYILQEYREDIRQDAKILATKQDRAPLEF
jgi:hypothetical protein